MPLMPNKNTRENPEKLIIKHNKARETNALMFHIITVTKQPPNQQEGKKSLQIKAQKQWKQQKMTKQDKANNTYR